VLKLTAPGIPDIYQGCELWDLSLVDPDNRRAVDYDLRRRLLKETEELTVEQVWERMEEGLPKLWTVHKTLQMRNERLEDFGARAEYRPLYAEGEKAKHLVAFGRGKNVIIMAPRLVIGLGGTWGKTCLTLPAGRWRNVFTDERVQGSRRPVGELLQRFPVAVMVRE
jgi:(1->4)-alpha-D-glucan 1-alpha-D-glucosylmutase